jgi:predicted nucleic acid-binding protein
VTGIKFLLDTNIVIGLLKEYEPAIKLAEEVGVVLEESAVSQITRMELLGHPKITLDDERLIQLFLKECQVLLIDERIEVRATQLRRSGLLKLPDAIVAATAVVNDLRLLTLDKKLALAIENIK